MRSLANWSSNRVRKTIQVVHIWAPVFLCTAFLSLLLSFAYAPQAEAGGGMGGDCCKLLKDWKHKVKNKKPSKNLCEIPKPVKKHYAKLKIKKSTEGGDAKFSFEYDVIGDNHSSDVVEFSTQGGHGSFGYIKIEAGKDVKVVETDIPNRWEFKSVECRAGSRSYSSNSSPAITIPASAVKKDDEWICHYRNHKRPANATFQIVKTAEGGDGNFTFDYDIANDNKAPAQIAFSTSGGKGGSPVIDIKAGQDIQVKEVTPGGRWEFKNVECRAGDRSFSSDNSPDLTIPGSAVKEGDDWVCHYHNLKRPAKATFQIVKNAEGGDGTFEFGFDVLDDTLPASKISISTSGGTGISDAVQIDAQKSIEVSETVSTGWKFESLDCTNGTDSVSSSASPKLTIDRSVVSDGDNWVCSFNNVRKTGRIIVKKETVGGDGNFDFAIDGAQISQSFSFQLSNGGTFDTGPMPTGSYTVTEANLPGGWSLKNASCDGNYTKTSNGVSVSLGAGAVTCTFQNYKGTDDKMEDITKLFVYRRLDNLLTHDPDRARIIRRLGKRQSGQISTSYTMDVRAAAQASAAYLGSPSANFGGSASHYGTPRGSAALLPGGLPSSLLGSSASQMPFALSGETQEGTVTGKFSFSLSDVRENLKQKEMEKIEASGLLLADHPNLSALTRLDEERWDIWVEGHASKYNDSTGGIEREGNFGVLYVGADYVLTPNVLIGALVQFDWTDEDVDDPDLKGNVDGNGWMAGPYIGVKFSDNLFFNARAAWGESDNDIALTDAVSGYRTGQFDTKRWLVTAELTGNWARVINDGVFRVTPSLKFAHGEEDQGAYRSSLGQQVGANKVTLTRLTFGPEFGYRYKLSNGSVAEPHVALEGVWNLDADNLKLSTGEAIGDEGLRGRVEGGVRLSIPGGVGMRLVGEYDGIGDDDLEAYGGQLWVDVPLN